MAYHKGSSLWPNIKDPQPEGAEGRAQMPTEVVLFLMLIPEISYSVRSKF